MDDSHPFRSMSIGCPIPEIKLFQTLTLKFQLQGQGHGCGQRARSYIQPSIILTHFVFISHQTNNSWERAISKFDLETSKVKVMSEVKGQGHILCPVSNWCTLFKGLSPVTRNLCCQSARGNRSGAVRYFPEAVRPRGNTAAPDRFPRADWQHKFLVTGLNPDYNMVTVRV